MRIARSLHSETGFVRGGYGFRGVILRTAGEMPFLHFPSSLIGL
jgi:hypothetical protein